MGAVLDLFSCIGCHAIGMHRAGHKTVAFCEVNPFRQEILATRFRGVPIYDDIRDKHCEWPDADIIVGGPPCQQTSVGAAVHGYRDGTTLWPDMLAVIRSVLPHWVVVEQPPGNAGWEKNVAAGLDHLGYYVTRLEFEARDVGAPYPRRRVFCLAGTSVQRLAVAWEARPSAFERVKRAAHARAAWDAGVLGTLRVDARSAGEMERSESRIRRERIEALGDSNPPEMMEVIGHMIAEADEVAAEQQWDDVT